MKASHFDIQKYVRGDIIPLSIIPNDVYEKYHEERQRFIRYRKLGSYRAKDPDIDTEREWWFIPNAEYEELAIQSVLSRYPYCEIYDKDMSGEWRNYLNERVVLIRCLEYRNKKDFHRRLETWISSESTKDTFSGKMISLRNVKIIIFTDYALPTKYQNGFKFKNLVNGI